ncbi:MAG: phosphoribosylformylglycinamidine synthase subunit PurQ [Planctomycetota bacterium]|nr:phosphoribosylformylglycinamidine synthase subunit PurQ [Planctomycetota bacterium]MEE2894881.1 phosphoribosylformylglycinamidine synthase subunit PurQ [Planctomycetota bacterium]
MTATMKDDAMPDGPVPRALVVTAPGINCDGELARAFHEAGAEPEPVLFSRLRRDPSIVDGFDLVGLPGGFSYGDDAGAGRILAQLIRRDLYPALSNAVARGVPMIAPCNGFQIAVQAGLLPGPDDGMAWPEEPARPTVALAPNEMGRFRDDWTRVEIPSDTRCIWTRGLADVADVVRLLPSAHGEGRFVAEQAIVDSLESDGCVAVRYADDANFNGSVGRIAGICDRSGLVFGLMPHPERFTRWTQHPTWTRLDATHRSEAPLGLRMFRNAVVHATTATACR